MLRTLHLGMSLIVIMLVSTACAQQPALMHYTNAATQNITIAEGIPLHIRVTHTANLHIGQPVIGVLTASIFVRDRMVLPTGSTVHGTVVAYTPVEHLVREQALLNGDVTPLHNPVVEFTTIHLAADNTDVPLDARALISDSQLVRFTAAKKQSLLRQGITEAKTRLHDTYDAIFAPGRKDRAMRLLYSQLPYHPQRIWAGTQFVAELSTPLTLQLPAQPPVMDSENGSLGGKVVDARLTETLTSATAKKGDTVVALVTAPVFDQDQKLILPEGAELDGLVSYSKPARSFGRNGQLRFAIRGVKPHQATTLRKETVYGTLPGPTAAPAKISPSTPKETSRRTRTRTASSHRCCWPSRRWRAPTRMRTRQAAAEAHHQETWWSPPMDLVWSRASWLSPSAAATLRSASALTRSRSPSTFASSSEVTRSPSPATRSSKSPSPLVELRYASSLPVDRSSHSH